jgi:hypothetical protein
MEFKGYLALSALLVWSLGSSALGGTFKHDAPPGQCRTVHGRMAIYNGTFSFRIWAIGTHRMLRVVDAQGDNFNDLGKLPPPLARAMGRFQDNLWGHAVFADFRVCDFTNVRPGVMQSVNVMDARHIRVVSED